MNDEHFDRKLADELRRVAVPTDLHAQLLELSRQPVAGPTPTPQPAVLESHCSQHNRGLQRKRTWRRRVWSGAAIVAGVAASLWLGWAFLGERRPPELAEQQPVATAVKETREEVAQAEPLAEIERMRGELRELERAYQALEQEELAVRFAAEVAEPAMVISLPDAELRKAEAIFWTAETSLFSGLKTEAVREQLKYLINEFPDSSPAKRATALLADL
jgi:hypothetical protein